MDDKTDKTVELADEALDTATGGANSTPSITDGTSNRGIIAVQPGDQAAKHPAKVTVPDIKLAIGYD